MITLLVIIFCVSSSVYSQKKSIPIDLKEVKSENKVDVLIDGELFTSYIMGTLKMRVVYVTARRDHQ